MHGMPTIGEVLDRAEAALKASDAVEHPHAGKERFDAEELLEWIVGPEWELDDPVSGQHLRRFDRLLARRLAGEPPAYITGRTTFAGLGLRVRPGAFIPRESSEWMAEQAVRRLRRRREAVLVDVATGIGPVALAVASRLPTALVLGVDISPIPIRLARENARLLGLTNVRFRLGDLFGPVPRGLLGRVDVVTVHPPYVGKRELKELPEEIRRFEPLEALTDHSPLGDRIVGQLAREAPAWLKPGGWLLVEVSPDRSRGVKSVLARAGFQDVRSTKGGVEVSRVVVGRA